MENIRPHLELLVDEMFIEADHICIRQAFALAYVAVTATCRKCRERKLKSRLSSTTPKICDIRDSSGKVIEKC